MIDIEKTFDEQHNFWVIKCPNGHLITEWKDGDDPREFAAFIVAYCPKDADLSIYRCIEVSKADEICALQEELLRQDEEQRQLEEKQKLEEDDLLQPTGGYINTQS